MQKAKQKSNSIKNNNAEVKNKKNSMDDAINEKAIGKIIKNIGVGARLFSKKTENLTINVIEDINNSSKDLLSKIKKKATEIYNSSENIAELLKSKTDEYIEKYKDKKEFEIAHKELKEKYIELGKILSKIFFTQKKEVQNIYRDKDVKKLVNEVEMIEKKIVNLGEKEQKNSI